jgi:hypothetical protein
MRPRKNSDILNEIKRIAYFLDAYDLCCYPHVRSRKTIPDTAVQKRCLENNKSCCIEEYSGIIRLFDAHSGYQKGVGE